MKKNIIYSSICRPINAGRLHKFCTTNGSELPDANNNGAAWKECHCQIFW